MREHGPALRGDPGRFFMPPTTLSGLEQHLDWHFKRLGKGRHFQIGDQTHAVFDFRNLRLAQMKTVAGETAGQILLGNAGAGGHTDSLNLLSDQVAFLGFGWALHSPP